MSLLSEEERTRISDAIAKVEKTTAGEVMVATVRQSDDYTMPRVPVAIGLAAAAAAVVGYVAVLGAAATVLIQMLLGLALYVVLGQGAAIRALVRRDELDARTQTRAFALFSELGVHRTREGSGILIAISELEHRVVILADYGIHARVGEREWQVHVDAIIEGIQNGRAANAIIDEVRALGEILAQEYPLEGENLNELPNRVEHRER